MEEGLERIRSYYWPYHEALRSLVENTKERFGYCILIDCHSMPSNSRPNRSTGNAAFVLGDCHGTTCAPVVTQTVEQVLSGKDYLVVRRSEEHTSELQSLMPISYAVF